MPNIERMAEFGTLFSNAFAPATSSLMCHSSEWTGRYPWELHVGVPFEERNEKTQIPFQDSIFTDLDSKGFDIHIILTGGERGEQFNYFKPVFDLLPKGANIVDLSSQAQSDTDNICRKDQIMMATKLIEESERKGRRAFVWIKCHGHNNNIYRLEFLRYAKQQRVSINDLYGVEIDEAIGGLLDHYNYPENKNCPTIWFASDHGNWVDGGLRRKNNNHLYQEIVHVPLVSSDGGGAIVEKRLSMKEIRRVITNKTAKMDEKFTFAETNFPGQITDFPLSEHGSNSKIMVIWRKWKYIYSQFDSEMNSSEPCEELFDLAYDPSEKFNLVSAFNQTDEVSDTPYHHTISRIHPNPRLVSNPNRIPGKMDNIEFIKSNEFSGWPNIYHILKTLRKVAKEIWENSGRILYFKF